MEMSLMPSPADPAPLTRFEMDQGANIPVQDKMYSPQVISDRILRRRAQFAKSQAAKDPSQRPDQMADLIEVQAASGLSEVAVYSCNVDPPTLYVAYDCPRTSVFDNVNEQEAQKLMLQAQEAMRILKQSRIYARASKIYHISNGCAVSRQVAERMSRMYSDKPNQVI
jgi:hypothetical protein